MLKFETINELTLKVQVDAPGTKLFTKVGAWVGGECYGGRNYKFEKRLLGPEGNAAQALMGQVMRRITGENLPLTEVVFNGPSVTYYSNLAQHVTVIKLNQGETISIESENILAFTGHCKYGVRFLGQGIISQKGLATSTLTGMGPEAYVAILTDGNPIVMSNVQNGSTLECDPDAHICHIGSDPAVKLDINWKTLIGQAQGETYMFEWTRPTTVIFQPSERKSGIDVSMDGKRTGAKPTTQAGMGIGQTANDMGSMLNGLGNMLGGNNGGNGGLGGLGGLGGIFG